MVVGDIMLDRYLWGTVDRISPEAPTPVVSQNRESIRAGGAGNVALNLAGLGLNVSIAGFVGDDRDRIRLMELFARSGIDTSAVITLSGRPTAVRTRVIAGHQHVLRFDSEDLSEIATQDGEKLSSAVMESLPAEAIVMVDYAKGALSSSFCQQLTKAARQQSTPLFAKPKAPDFSKYSGANVLIPNLAELSRVANVSVADIDELLGAAKSYVDTLGLEFLVVSRGADGMTLLSKDRTVHSSAKAREVFDVSGAGDTVIACIAAATIANLDYEDILHVANLAAGIVVGQVGTAVIDQSSLMHAMHAEGNAPIASIYALDDILPILTTWRSKRRRIVFTEGDFDGIYQSTVNYLHEAERSGDQLIVGISSDNALQSNRGNQSQLNGQQDRASVVAALTPVNAVILCDDERPLQRIKAIRPDVLVLAADAKNNSEDVIEAVEAYGGRIEFLSGSSP